MTEVLRKRLRKALGAAEAGAGGKASFCAGGDVSAVPSGLEIEGLRRLTLPIDRSQGKMLQKLFEPAPYGKGTQTVVDTEVRMAWRLTPDKFRLTNPEWARLVAGVVDTVQAELGLEDQTLEAHLYDLLYYEKGGFFLPHQDGEKQDRMVGTLLVGLPSDYTGGELVVRHDGKKETFKLRSGETRVSYAAFYADCEHEVLPVRSGRRLCLVYNLTLGTPSSDEPRTAEPPAKKKGKKAARAGEPAGAPSKPLKAAASKRRKTDAAPPLQPLLEEWIKSGEEKLAIGLEHEYSKAGLAWDTLKGTDRAAAKALIAAARNTGCRLYLGLAELHEAGSAEGGYDDDFYGRSSRYGRRSSRWSDEEDFEDDPSRYTMGDLYDWDLSLSKLTDPDGGKLSSDAIDLADEELLNPDLLRSVVDREEFEGYTGNAGMTLDRWYHRAVILLWPDAKHYEVLCGRYSRNAVPNLTEAVAKWKKASKAKAPAWKAECVGIAAAVLKKWPKKEHNHGYQSEVPDKTSPELFKALADLDDPSLLRQFMSETMVLDCTAQPGKALAAVCRKHGWETFLPALKSQIDQTTEHSLRRNLAVLETICSADASDAGGAAWKDACRNFGTTLLNAFRTIDADATRRNWQKKSVFGEVAIPAFVRSFVSAEQDDLLSDFLVGLLRNSAVYPIDTFQIPALLRLKAWLKKHVGRPFAGLERWVAGCRVELETLTAQVPPEPTDFRRPAELSCQCAHCRQLKEFLQSPSESTRAFPMRQDLRNHLEHEIRRSSCDIDHTTNRSRSPHALVCTKNTNSWKASVKKYHADLKRLDEVRAVERDLPRRPT